MSFLDPPTARRRAASRSTDRRRPRPAAYTREPFLEDGRLVWREGPERSLDEAILRPLDKPFSAEGGLRLMEGKTPVAA